MKSTSTHIASASKAAPLLFLAATLLLIDCTASGAQEKPETDVSDWSFFLGYGTSHPGWGETKERVETIDAVARHQILIKDRLGSSWYSGYHSLLLELPVHYLPDYSGSPMVGLNFLAAYTFTSFELQPYIFAGGGPVYVDADIPGIGSDWNGNYQFGAGISYPISMHNRLFMEARYHHISNGNTSDPNDPLNSTKFLVGFSF